MVDEPYGTRRGSSSAGLERIDGLAPSTGEEVLKTVALRKSEANITRWFAYELRLARCQFTCGGRAMGWMVCLTVGGSGGGMGCRDIYERTSERWPHPLLLATNTMSASYASSAAALGWRSRASRFVHAYRSNGCGNNSPTNERPRCS